MLLKRLKEYNPRIQPDDDEEIPAEYLSQTIPWIVEIDSSSGHASLIRTSGGAGKRDPGKRFNVPFLKRSGTNIKPQLLADKAEVALGFAADNPERAQKRHTDFVALVEACAQTTKDWRIQCVASFLRNLAQQPLELPQDLQANEFVTFAVDGVRLVDLPSVRQFWMAVAPQLGQKGLAQLTPELIVSWLSQEDESVRGRCLICGEHKPIARVHPVPIKLPRAVADKQLAVVSANKEAFYSYGLEQSFIAPTCRDCAASYANALNALARSKQNSLVMGGAIFLYWTREDIDFDLMTLLDKPEPESVRLLFESARSGKQSATIDSTAFYATSLSGSGARVVVRDWIDTTLGEVQTNLRRWFAWQRIVNPYGEEARPLGMFQLASATVREAKDILPTTPQALLNAALRGTPLPRGLLYQAVRRNRAEQGVTQQRATLIKLVFASHNAQQEEDRMAQLNTDNTNPAYLCGRLLAVLEDIQRAAIPGAKATIVDRFFGTASSAPASVFGRLMRGAQPHLSKLERDNRGAYMRLQRSLESITVPLNSFPRTLTLEEQGLFSLGYYHQRAHERAEAKAASERKRAGQAEIAEETGL